MAGGVALSHLSGAGSELNMGYCVLCGFIGFFPLCFNLVDSRSETLVEEGQHPAPLASAALQQP